MRGAIAAHGDDEAIARRGGVVRGIAAPGGLNDIRDDARRGTGGGTALPEAAGSTATG